MTIPKSLTRKKLRFRQFMFVVFLVFLSFAHLHAAFRDDFIFKGIDADKGLSQNYVDCIYQDKQGFLWFATWGGLDRYDGYELRKFNTQNGLLNTNFTHCIVEDEFSRLWIGTDFGIQIISVKTGTLPDNLFNGKTSLHNMHGSVNCILADGRNKMWVACDSGLFLVLLNKNGEVQNVRSLLTLPVFSLAKEHDGRIWAGMADGKIHIISTSKNRVPTKGEPPKSLQTNGTVLKIFVDKVGLVWIGTTTGLFRYNPHTSMLDQFTETKPSDGPLPNSYINDIAQDKTGKIWIATLSGLAIWEPENRTFSTVRADGTENTISNNFVNSLFVDRQNIVWVGTEKGGINWIYPRRKVFGSIKNHPSDKSGIPLAPVNSILEDRKGRLWIGLAEGGLHVCESNQSKFRHYYSSNNPQSLSHNTVSKIVEDYYGRIWLGTWGGGISLLKNKTFTRYNSSDSRTMLVSDFVADIEEDIVTHGLWLATNSGLQFFDYSENRCLSFKDFKRNDIPNQVSVLHLDQKRRLWAGTNFGLYCIWLDKSNIQKGHVSYTLLKHEINQQEEDRQVKVISICEDRSGRLWFGTNGSGLYQLDEEVRSDEMQDEKAGCAQVQLGGRRVNFCHFGKEHGLSDDVIYTIQQDYRGDLWMSTNNGLCRFSPSLQQAESYFKSDGLLSNQFYWMASCKSVRGLLYFGNMSGVNIVNPSRIEKNDYMPEVRFTSLRIFNERIQPGVEYHGRVYLSNELFFSNELIVPEKDNSFSIELSSFDFESPERIRFAYKLEGLNNEWIELPDHQRSIFFSNLNHGHYKLKARCTNSDGVWSDHVTALDLYVKPPFYETMIFKIAILLLLILLVFYIYTRRLRKFRKEQLELETKVSERTLQIEKQKELLREQAENLEKTLHDLIAHEEAIVKQNELLRNQNVQILEQKNQLESFHQKVLELNQDKLSLFTNITHEFKTPITLIMGPIQQMIQESKDEETLSKLHLMERNSQQLLSLVNQLMDFRKVDAAAMRLNKTQCNLFDLCKEILEPFDDMVQKRGVQCSLSSTMQNHFLQLDVEKMTKILTNLLSNAVKFTPDNGNIAVRLSEVEKDSSGWVRVAVSDNGPGIPEEEAELVFDRFYQIKGQKVYQNVGQSGTGIGLYLCRELATLMGGVIYAMTGRDGGARFVLELPIESTQAVSSGNSRPVKLNEPEDIEHNGKPTMLLVEDNSDMRQFIRSFMDSWFNVIEAGDGIQAWELIQQYIPHFIVSDVMMPRMDGYRLCKLVKSTMATSHIPVILLTALSSVEKQLEGLDSGADDYVTKPFDGKILMARIRNLMDTRNRLHDQFRENMNESALDMMEDSPDKKLLDKAFKILQDNYQNPDFDVTELIQEIGISRSLLHKKLDSLVGQSASRFIRGYRLNKAKEILEQNRGMNISEVAYAVGFNDPKYFTRCFTKHFGISPSNWENRH